MTYRLMFRRAILAVFGILALCSHAADLIPIVVQGTAPEILVLNSYHPGYIWTEGEMTGIRSVLTKANPQVRFAVEYLDWKRFPSQENEKRFLALLQFKYGAHPVKAAIATDDSALDFLLRHRAEIAPGVPIVFSGINATEYDSFQGKTGITGVMEILHAKETLELALRLQPDIKKVLVVHDYTEAGLATRTTIEADTIPLRSRLQFEFIKKLTFDEILATLEKLTPDTVVLFTGMAVDSNGKSPTAQFRADLTRRCAVPAYVISEDAFRDIGVGGSLISGAMQGQTAAEIALRVLAGEAVEGIPIVTNPPTRKVVDYQRLRRFNLPLKNLPPGVELVNQPDSTLWRFRWHIAVVAIIIIILSACILVLSLNIQRRKRAEMALRNSEAHTRLILDSALDAVVVMDAAGKITGWNPKAEEMFGWKRTEVLGKLLGDTIIPPRFRKAHEQGLQNFLRGKKGGLANRRVELTAMHRDGREYTVELAVTQLHFEQETAFSAFIRDVTEANRARETLDRTVALYRRAIAAAGAVPYLYDYASESYLYMGEEIKVLTGYSAEEMTPAVWNQICGETKLYGEPAAIGNEREAIARARDGKVVNWRSDSLVQTKDGRPRWISDSSVEILGDDGRSTGSIGILTDITERKLAEETLRASEQRFRLMVENLPAGAVYIDLESGLLRANKETEAITGYSRQELATLDQWFPMLWGDNHQAVRDLYEADRRAGFPSPRTLPITRKDGQIRVVEFVAYGFSSGEIVLLHDVTERKRAEEALRESEERFRTVVECLGEAVIITDMDDAVLYVNSQILQITGYSQEDMLGRNAIDVLHLQKTDSSRTAEIPFEEPDRYESSAIHKNGRQIWLEISRTPFSAHNGRTVGAIRVISDLTDRKHAEAQLRQAQKMEAIGTLAGGIAHDFNNILAALMLFCELASLESIGNPRLQEYLTGMLKGCHRARDLVKQILTFSRQQEQSRQVISLQPVIRDTLKLLRASIPAMIELVDRVDSATPPVLADSTQVHQVLMNLGANAAHAMKAVPGRLEITLMPIIAGPDLAATVPDLKPGRYARLTVSDTGHGMDAATLDRIFEPFYTTKPTGEGTGLGLSVVHGIVRSHEGAISVKSAPGQGTTFSIYFPAAKGTNSASQELSPFLPSGRGEKILVVDDEQALVDTLTLVLNRFGYRSIGKNLPRDAVHALENEPGAIDAAILDLAMPGMDGIQLARLLRQRQPDLPIILTSGHFRPEDAEKAQAIQIQKIIQKPYSPQEICQALSEILSHTRISSHSSDGQITPRSN